MRKDCLLQTLPTEILLHIYEKLIVEDLVAFYNLARTCSFQWNIANNYMKTTICKKKVIHNHIKNLLVPFMQYTFGLTSYTPDSISIGLAYQFEVLVKNGKIWMCFWLYNVFVEHTISSYCKDTVERLINNANEKILLYAIRYDRPEFIDLIEKIDYRLGNSMQDYCFVQYLYNSVHERRKRNIIEWMVGFFQGKILNKRHPYHRELDYFLCNLDGDYFWYGTLLKNFNLGLIEDRNGLVCGSFNEISKESFLQSCFYRSITFYGMVLRDYKIMKADEIIKDLKKTLATDNKKQMAGYYDRYKKYKSIYLKLKQ